jgi:hypothetical protein
VKKLSGACDLPSIACPNENLMLSNYRLRKNNGELLVLNKSRALKSTWTITLNYGRSI